MKIQMRYLIQDGIGDNWTNRMVRYRSFTGSTDEELKNKIDADLNELRLKGWHVIEMEVVNDNRPDD